MKRIAYFSTPVVILLLLIFMSLVPIFLVPNPGFSYTYPDFAVSVIELDLLGNSGLEKNDILVSINGKSTAETFNKTGANIFIDYEAGEILDFVVDREGELLNLNWEFSGNTSDLIIERLISSIWWVYLPFWLVGTLTLVFISPRDTKQKLLILFNYLTALWLAVGSALSPTHMFAGPVLLRIFLWLCVPIYWHLHWNFPKPLGKLPKWLVNFGYAAAIFMALLEVFKVLPSTTLYFSFLLAVGGMFILILCQLIFNKEHRSGLRLLVFSMFIAILMASTAIVPTLLGFPIPFHLGGSILAFPLIPLAYFFTLFRFQFNQFEVRANKLISIYIFILVISIFNLLAIPIFNDALAVSPHLSAAVIGIVSLLLGIWAYAPFARFVEEKLLGISIPPQHLLQTYNSRITTTFSFEQLEDLLMKEVMPSLLIRQSILLVKKNGALRTTASLGQPLETPSAVDLEKIESSSSFADGYFPHFKFDQDWIKLILPLFYEHEIIGYWLFGRRDPEDYYSSADIQFLRTLAASTASAVKNIQQKDQLRTLFEINISRQESEKEALARNLHDLVLNRLAILIMNLEDSQITPAFDEQYEKLTSSLRDTIQDLRPPTLGLGLVSALEELADDTASRASGAAVDFSVDHTTTQFNKDFEAHIFRIVQQACDNALKHADFNHVSISGEIHEDAVHLIIEDDGEGFSMPEPIRLEQLLEGQNFGLANMFERAQLIGADLQISSPQAGGTSIQLIWHK